MKLKFVSELIQIASLRFIKALEGPKITLAAFFRLDFFYKAVFRSNFKWHDNGCHYIARTAAGGNIIHDHFDSKHN